jgi:hypothetical protein
MMAPTSNHCVNYWLKNQAGEDFSLTLEGYISYAYFGSDVEDLNEEELAQAARDFEEAISELRGEE